jgi:hypothetical protein
MELQEILKQRKEEYKQLKKEIRELEEQCDELELILKAREEEAENLEDVLRDKEVQIAALEKTLAEKAPVLTESERKVVKVEIPKILAYKAVKGDEVDELLAQLLIQYPVNIPVRRLEPGYYLFGTKKIYAKVMNNKLVIRVGGGYMSFQEFRDTYSHVEETKIRELME